jgi:CxxC motif-containing protein
MDGEADIIAAEIKRLQALKKTKENSAVRLKEALTSAMLIFGQEDNKGIKRFETPTIKLSTRKSESVNITDEASVPEQYWVVKREISKTAITNSIKAGEIVEGAEMKTNYSVTIR